MKALTPTTATRRLVVAVCVVAIAVFLVAAMYRIRAWRAEWEERKRELIATMESAQPLIDAIRAFEAANGHPPARLEDLAPTFIERIPEPAGPADGGWEYWTSAPGGRIEGGRWHRVRLDSKAGGWALGIAVRKGFRPRFLYELGDYFVFHPSGMYSAEAYGGVLERIDGWGYYHERPTVFCRLIGRNANSRRG